MHINPLRNIFSENDFKAFNKYMNGPGGKELPSDDLFNRL